MSLTKYKQKRRFADTPEPEGSVAPAHRKLEFVVQKHHASRLHYDFRLELDGVLKSWAVPKGPPMNPADKRLAMMVEDHPYEYRKFEGIIPDGNYGAGKVIIWDNGSYELDRQQPDWPASLKEGLEKGELKFIMHGKKLKGSFALIKTPHMGENAWLLIKHKDKFATTKDITQQSKSVISGKEVDEIGSDSAKWSSKQKSKLKIEDLVSDLPKSPMPRYVKPMLATLTDRSFDDEEWLFEIKWDGYRAISSWDGKKAQLYSRNGNNFVQKYPAVAEALRKLRNKVVLDGEIVALDEQGRSNFGWLQNYGRGSNGQLAYYVFDILWCDGHDLTDSPLLQRKQILQKVIIDNSIIFFSDHIKARGVDFYKTAEKQKLEGIMAKNCVSKYRQDFRSKQWLKIKTHMRQEAVIGGFTEPKGSRQYIGALILGVYEADKLRYIGHTGGGIPPKLLPELRKQLQSLEQANSPFSDKFKPNAPVHWVKPKLLAEVSFSEWTEDGHMRQPIFAGLRSDIDPKQVVQEIPKEGEQVKKDSKKSAPSSAKLEFSHLDKVFFDKAGYTKGDLVDYYSQISQYILPYIKDRPHSLLRQPNGIDGESFFQKDMDHMPPKWIKTKPIYSESNQKNINYLVADTKDSLLYMVQLGCIEINPWNSKITHLDKPDWCVIDLDPEDISFEEVVKVANTVHQLCEELKIPSYPKTSGKTGVHIYIPLGAKYTYEQCKQFAQILANIIHERASKTTSIERSPKKRQQKIYVDFLQNRAGQTLAAPYSVRPTPAASVSTPLHWDEVHPKLSPDQFTIKNMSKRLDDVGDIWKPVLGKGINLTSVLKQLE